MIGKRGRTNITDVTENNANECKFKEAKCHSCGKLGHIAKACRNKNRHRESARPTVESQRVERRARPHRSHKVGCECECGRRDRDSSGQEEEAFTLTCLKTGTSIQRIKPFEVNVEVNKKKVAFEINMGCSVSIMNEVKFKETWEEKQCPSIKQSKLLLKSYTVEKSSRSS